MAQAQRRVEGTPPPSMIPFELSTIRGSPPNNFPQSLEFSTVSATFHNLWKFPQSLASSRPFPQSPGIHNHLPQPPANIPDHLAQSPSTPEQCGSDHGEKPRWKHGEARRRRRPRGGREHGTCTRSLMRCQSPTQSPAAYTISEKLRESPRICEKLREAPRSSEKLRGATRRSIPGEAVAGKPSRGSTRQGDVADPEEGVGARDVDLLLLDAVRG